MATNKFAAGETYFKPFCALFFVTVDKLSNQHEKSRQIENKQPKRLCCDEKSAGDLWFL